jgi:hypothetical protein
VGTFASAAGGGSSEAREWQRSKFCEAESERKISGTATGHNGPDSKSDSFKRRNNIYIRIGIEVGTFASAAGGGKSEQKGVAAVEILRSGKRAKNFGHRNRT